MDYPSFKNSVINLPLISGKDLMPEGRTSQVQALRNQLKRWQDRGLVIKLKKGVYIINTNDRRINPSLPFIANQLYAPSYVSLEYAFSFYGLIPERTHSVTSVAARKTTRFENDIGRFIYQHIKPQAFRGFKAVKDEAGLSFFIAEPEKAVVDFLYLNLDRFKDGNEDIFQGSYRFQNTGTLRRGKIFEFSALFKSRKLDRIAGLFCEFSKKEG